MTPLAKVHLLALFFNPTLLSTTYAKQYEDDLCWPKRWCFINYSPQPPLHLGINIIKTNKQKNANLIKPPMQQQKSAPASLQVHCHLVLFHTHSFTQRFTCQADGSTSNTTQKQHKTFTPNYIWLIFNEGVLKLYSSLGYNNRFQQK